MEKWIFVNNITSLEKLYLLTKAVKEKNITKFNHTSELMHVLNNNGANRTEANKHPINFVLFYNMVKLEEDRYKPTNNGVYLIDNYNKLVSNKKLRAEFFFKVLYNVKFPNIAVETSKLYDVYPFRIIFKLLFDDRVNRRISIKEFETMLSMVRTEDDYELIVNKIIDYRAGIDIEINCEKIAQVNTVVSGWCKQFNVFRRGGEYIMISNDLDIKLPKLSENNGIVNIPYTKDFRKFVLYNYLFEGMSMASIENKFFDNNRPGFLVKDVIDYFYINNEENKGIYSGKDLEVVINFLSLQNGEKYRNIALALGDVSEEEKINQDFIDTPDRIKGGYDMIYYGVPGCGKSYLVNSECCKDNSIVFRTTFHPEYSNSDFVGQIIPKLDNRNNVFYDFQEGPFSKALLSALVNPLKEVYLIIEELNRGNASSIFGDIFQLIDRDDDGKSQYSIDNYSITKYLNDNGIKNFDKIYLPSNLWIIATMNTSDQNVFTLDNAFQRRWRRNRIRNEFPIDCELATMKVPGSNYTWKEFVEEINEAILRRNPAGLNSEDKQIGVFFATKRELVSEGENNIEQKEKNFVEKVLLYVWDDVAKIDPSLWFDGDCRCFDDVVKEFSKKHLGIFKGIFLKDKESGTGTLENE